MDSFIDFYQSWACIWLGLGLVCLGLPLLLLMVVALTYITTRKKE